MILLNTLHTIIFHMLEKRKEKVLELVITKTPLTWSPGGSHPIPIPNDKGMTKKGMDF